MLRVGDVLRPVGACGRALVAWAVRLGGACGLAFMAMGVAFVAYREQPHR